MTREEIINALQDDKTMPFIQPEQLANIVDFVSENCKPSLPDGLEEAAHNFAIHYDNGTCDGIVQDGFIAGAEWGMNQMPLPEDTVLFNRGVEEGKRLAEEEQADLFTIVALDAAQRAKAKMMEKAVDGRYMKADGKVYVESWLLDIDPDSVKAGDEVRLIVIPKED